MNGTALGAVFTLVREFRYDSDRGRYLVRDCSLDPAKFAKPIGDRWTEYLGDDPHRDFEVDVSGSPGNQTATAVPVRRYIRGYGLIATEDENGNMQFVHGDLLGSTRLLTEGSDTQTLGEPTARGEYLAFGGVLDLSSLLNGRGGTGGPGSSGGPGTSGGRGGTGILPVVPIRYGWCGSWGYQNDALEELGAGGFGGGVPSDGAPTGGTPTLADDELELGLLHIGARYYSPEIGRWVQRDPISVQGGVNVYSYCLGNPNSRVDPSGRFSLLELLSAAFTRTNVSTAFGLLATAGGIFGGIQAAQTPERTDDYAAGGLVLVGTFFLTPWGPIVVGGAYATAQTVGQIAYYVMCLGSHP